MQTTPMSTPSGTADIAEAFALAGLTLERSEWGHALARLDEDWTLQVSQDDNAFHVVVFSGGRRMMIASEVTVSGAAANPVTLAAIMESMIR